MRTTNQWISRFTYLILTVGVATVAGVQPVIVPPVNNAATEAALIIVQGAFISGTAYQPLADAIQQNSTLRLWVVLLTNFTANFPSPRELPMGVSGAIAALKEQGMQSDNVFLAGHSVGGVFVGPYAASHATELKGVLLFASYLTRDVRLATYPLPVLHISGDLDGMIRITRIADTFQELESDVKHDNSSIYNTPVIVMGGVNHFQFASGPKTPRVIDRDLTPEVSSEEAYELIANHAAAFLVKSLSSPSADVTMAEKILQNAYRETKEKIELLLDFKMYDGNQFNTDYWGKFAQEMISTLPTAMLQVNSKLVPEEAEFLQTEPIINTTGHLPQVTTFGYVTFTSNPRDISAYPSSPQEVAVKMKSFEAIQSATRLVDPDLGGNLTCKDINELALVIALQYSSDLANQRYLAKGRPIFFHDDHNCSTEMEWYASDITLTEDDAGLHVTSPGWKTPLNASSSGGMQYCKLLSPYRAAEWMYVDSLRDHAATVAF